MTSTSPYLPDWEWDLWSSDGATYIGPLGSATSRSVTWQLDGPATAQFTMSAFSPEVNPAALSGPLELSSDVVVSRRGSDGTMKAIFRGRITGSTETHQDDQHDIQFVVTDYRGMLDRRVLWPDDPLEYDNLDVAEIAWTLIQNNQTLSGDYDLGITQGVGYPTGNVVTRTFTAGSTVGESIEQLGNSSGGPSLSGFDWEVDVNLKFNVYYPQRGTDHGVNLVYGDNMVGFTKTVNPDYYANYVLMTGGKPSHAQLANGDVNQWVRQPAFLSALIPSGVGVWEQHHADPSQTLAAVLQQEAAGWLTDYGYIWDQTFVVTLPAGVWDPATLWVGDTAHLTMQVGRLDMANVAKRVDQLTVTLDDNGVELVQVNMGISPPKHTRRFKKLDTRITGVEVAPKTHILATTASPVSGTVNTWFLVVGYVIPDDAAHEGQFYRAQVHIYVTATSANVMVRARFTDIGGDEVMTIVPSGAGAMSAGVWFPPSVQFAANQGSTIYVEAYSDNATTTVSGQIEGV
jgi:hypothetical protein